MKPLIGITVGEIVNDLYPWSPRVYGQNYMYCAAIERAGGVPCLIPLMSDPKNLRFLYEKLDGVLFSGGNDINPKLYGQEAHSKTIDVSDARDSIEIQLLNWALSDKKPVLAVCRGMQLLNVVCGGTLYQDIADDIKNADDHTLSTVHKDVEYQSHKISINKASKLAGIIKKQSLSTNSHHHQAVKDIGSGLEAVAWAEDGVIEAIESRDDSYLLGMQCHPESLEAKVVPEFRCLFKSFIVASSRK